MSYHSRRALIVTSALAMLLIISAGLAAQSGRRTPKTKSAPVPVPTPEPEVAVAQPTPTPKPVLTLLVGLERFHGFYYYDILDACTNRLKENRAVKVIPVETVDMTWGEAVRRAKKETEAHVVRLFLATAPMSRDIELNVDAVEYWVFAPTTAKVVTSGRVYGAAFRRGSVIFDPDPKRTSGIHGDYRLRQAAREAAERILSAMKHPIPTKPIPAPVGE